MIGKVFVMSRGEVKKLPLDMGIGCGYPQYHTFVNYSVKAVKIHPVNHNTL